MHANPETGSQNVNSGLAKDRVKRRYLVLGFLVTASAMSAWRFLKNCIKVLIGRDLYFNEQGLFLRQYVLHLTGLRPIRKITCRGHRGEGPGSQALMVMNAINFARSFGLTYLHTPFTHIQHADRPIQEWVTAWEGLFNLGTGEAVCGQERQEAVNFSHNFHDLDLIFDWHSHNDELADHFKDMIPEFRRKYYLNKSPRTTEEVTVAVHIRRGYDVPANHSLRTSTNSILRTITQVKGVLDAHRVQHRISVYSEGNNADFAEICIPGVELSKYRVGHRSEGKNDDIGKVSLPNVESFLHIDAFCAMRELIEADVLIMSKSSFCYYAALISEGIKILEPITLSGNDYLPGWKWRRCSPTDRWIPCVADGSFDSVAFERQLFLVVQSKSVAAINASTGDSDQKSNDLT